MTPVLPVVALAALAPIATALVDEQYGRYLMYGFSFGGGLVAALLARSAQVALGAVAGCVIGLLGVLGGEMLRIVAGTSTSGESITSLLFEMPFWAFFFGVQTGIAGLLGAVAGVAIPGLRRLPTARHR